MPDLPCERLLLGISGSIHSTQIGEYLLAFRRGFAKAVRVIMTPTAAGMVPPRTVRLHTDEPVYTDLWGTAENPCPHIRLTQWATLFVVLPASANILGKAAAGIADDLLSTAILASPTPVVFAPGMNVVMYRSAAVQRNLRTLRDDGHYVIPPGEGVALGTGEYDHGSVGPTVDGVLPHLWHVLMKRLRAEYWDEATAAPPRTAAGGPAPTASPAPATVLDLQPAGGGAGASGP